LAGDIGLIIGPIHHNTKLSDKKALSGQGNVNLSTSLAQVEPRLR
jgi:hypothetical protein